jgi:hypothetical protein
MKDHLSDTLEKTKTGQQSQVTMKTDFKIPISVISSGMVPRSQLNTKVDTQKQRPSIVKKEAEPTLITVGLLPSRLLN